MWGFQMRYFRDGNEANQTRIRCSSGQGDLPPIFRSSLKESILSWFEEGGQGLKFFYTD